MIEYRVAAAQPQQLTHGEPFHRYIFDDGTVWTEFFRTDRGYLLRFPDLADFAVTADGNKVVAHPAPGTDEVTLEHLYINQLVPLAMSRQGRPAYHASVVTVAGGAVAFLGNTGAGKSTLAASFALRDSAFLTDDALLIEESDDGCKVVPSHPSLRLWDDSVEALVDADSPQADPISYSTKTRLLAGKALAYSEASLPLRAAFVLCGEDSPAIRVEALGGLDRYMAWINNSFLLDIEDPELLARHFEWTHRISSAVPTFSLDYPRDYGILPDVHDVIRQRVAQIND
jgi:hypothetical protein